jgi:hypothetical protein
MTDKTMKRPYGARAADCSRKTQRHLARSRGYRWRRQARRVRSCLLSHRIAVRLDAFQHDGIMASMPYGRWPSAIGRPFWGGAS